MKAIYKKIGLAATIGYFFGILMVAYLLVTIPQDFKNISAGLSMNIISQLEPLFNKLNVSIAVVLGLGMVSLILLLFNNQQYNNQSNIFIASGKRENESLTNDNSESEGEASETIITKVESILSKNDELSTLSKKTLWAICKEFEASQGAMYIAQNDEGKRIIELISSFAYPIADSQKIAFEFGEGLAGQAAKEAISLNIDNVPDGYLQIISGLGGSSPNNLFIIPLIHENKVCGVVEIASFKKINKKEEDIIKRALKPLAAKFIIQKESTPAKKKSTIAQ